MCFGKLIDPNDILIRSLESQGIQRLYTPPDEPLKTEPHANGSPSALKSEHNGYPHPSTTTNTGTSSDHHLAKSTSHQINTNNHKRELKKLNHSILIAYLDLLEILVKAPNTQIQIEQTIANNQAYSDSETATNPPPATITTTIIKTLREQKLEDIELLFINMHHLINELRPHQARDNIRCTLEMQKQQRIETAQKFKQHLYKIVDLLKMCIQSIQGASGTDGPPNSKANVFLEELAGLMANANSLTKSLDKFDKTAPKQLNGNHTLHEASSDIEMQSEEIQSSFSSGSSRKKEAAKQNVTACAVLPSVAKQPFGGPELADSCDFKDLILCDLIDEFLIKENEF